MNEVYFQDCVEGMEAMDYIADMVIADPQYGIKESSKNHASRDTPVRQKNGNSLSAPRTTYKSDNWDDEPPGDNYFVLIRARSAHQIIFGANYFKQIVGEPFKPPRRDKWAEFLVMYPVGWIIWDKVNGGSDFNDCELIYTTLDFPSYILPYMWNGMMQGKSMDEPYTVQGNKKLNEKRIHPTQKPVLLYKQLLISHVIQRGGG